MHAERILIDYEGVNREAEFLVDGDTLHVASKWGERITKAGPSPFTRAQIIFREILDEARFKGELWDSLCSRVKTPR